MRAFHGARQGTRSASAGSSPGFDWADPDTKPTVAVATMHNTLADDAVQLANGERNVPIHPAQVATEGDDKQGWGGDAAQHDPSGLGRGT